LNTQIIEFENINYVSTKCKLFYSSHSMQLIEERIGWWWH
jgi:hypothetical protein